MPTHWTYRAIEPGDGLFQGDIIAREPLQELLRGIHAHFCDPKYLAFIVVTQTCDLVLRNGRCKTQYIGLAVVRTLSSILPEVLEAICRPLSPGVFSEESRVEAEKFLHRVLNQNEQAYGLVYIHPDGDLGIGEPAVALLRINISLRSKEHYELLRKSRVGRLDTEYRNKMGWLTGNLYSRVDTTDRAEKEKGEEQEKAIIKDLLDSSIGGYKPLWLPSSWIQASQKKIDLNKVPTNELSKFIQSCAPKPPIEVAIGEAIKMVEVLRMDFGDKPVETFRQKMESDSCLLLLIRPVIRAVTLATLIDADLFKRWHFEEAATTDDFLRRILVNEISETARKFLNRRGSRQLSEFKEALQTLNIFTRAIERLEYLGEESFGSVYLERKSAVDAAFQNAKTPPQLVEHLHSVALASVQESLADRLGKRLENSSVFKSAIRLR